MKVKQVWEMYVKDRRFIGYSERTLEGYGIQCRLLRRHFGESVRMLDLEESNLRDYLIESSENLKPASVGFRIKFLRSFFRWAMDEGIISKNPTIRLQEPKQGSRMPKMLSREKVSLVLSKCQIPLEHALLRLLYATGSRIGEIHKTNIKDVNLEERTIRVVGKGDKERIVFFDMDCKVWLQTYLESRNDEEEALFVTERNPKRRTSIEQLRYVVKRVAKRTGLEESIYPHRFRHSRASHLVEKDAPLSFVQSILGHAKIETTQIYVHVNDERRKRMYDQYV